jgi:hypothetical protein
MRKTLVSVIAAALVAAGAIGGGNSASADDNGADWVAAGTAITAPPAPFAPAMLHVNAQSNAGGGNVRGHFWIRYANGGGEFGGPIVCLNVVGQSAFLYGKIEKVKTPRAGFDNPNSPYVPIRLIDGGEPGTTFDVVNFDPGQAAAPNSQCTQNAGYVPISQGNYVVHDHPLADLLGLNQLLAQFEQAADDPYGS